MIYNKKVKRIRRHQRVRAKVAGTAERPRLSVFRSNRRVCLQAIDDGAGKTLIAASAAEAEVAAADMAKKAQAGGIKAMVFDRGGFLYHGRVKKVAEILREAGIKI